MSKFSFTQCTASGAMGKTLSLKNGKLEKQPPLFFPSNFTAKKITTDLAGLAKVLSSAGDGSFLIHGVANRSPVKVISKRKKEGSRYVDSDRYITRSPENFTYLGDVPGLFMLDIDEEGYSQQDIEDMLVGLDPIFKDAGYVISPSSSSCAYTQRNRKKRVLSGTKWHIYFVAQQGQDISRFIRVLFKKSVLAGLGHAFITKDGSRHQRSFFDLSVVAPYRIDFVAPPILVKPVQRDGIGPVHKKGSLLDTLLLDDLTSKEEKAYVRVSKSLLKGVEQEAKQVREKYIEQRIEEYIGKTGNSYAVARSVVVSRYYESNEVRLHYDDLVEFEDGDEETLFVKDIIANAEDFVGRAVKDPAEPEYGTGKACIYLTGGRLLINSFVHGGRKFILSGRMTQEYDTDDNARLVGFRLDDHATGGAWSELMLRNWCKVKDGGRIKYARLIKESNRYLPIPERGSGVSSLFELNPLILLDEKNFLQAMPQVPVVIGWDTNKNEPLYKPIGQAFIQLPNIDFKEGGITLAKPSEEGDKVFLNKWMGFPVHPRKGRVHKVIDRYFEEFLDYEDEAGYDFFWSYIYHMFQQPFEKPGSAIFMQSKQGTGKGTFIQCLSSLIGPMHSGFIDKMESLTGRFNSVIAGKLLIYADEITFGGYHQANNTLKKIISDEYLMVEEKYQAPYRIANVSRLFFSANGEWGVSVELSDRRYFVPQVSDVFQQDTEFFTELRYQWNRGHEAVMDRFMRMPVVYDVSTPPKTKGKSALIEVSMSGVASFMHDVLTEGVLDTHGIDFLDGPVVFRQDAPTVVTCDTLYSIYKQHSTKFQGQAGQSVVSRSLFWKEVYGLFGGKERSGIVLKGRIGSERRSISFPPLPRLQLLWDEVHGSGGFD